MSGNGHVGPSPLLCDLCKVGGDADAHLNSIAEKVVRQMARKLEDIRVFQSRHEDIRRLGQILKVDPGSPETARSMVLFGHVLHRVLSDRLTDTPPVVVDFLVAHSTVPIAWPSLYGRTR